MGLRDESVDGKSTHAMSPHPHALSISVAELYGPIHRGKYALRYVKPLIARSLDVARESHGRLEHDVSVRRP